MHFTVTLNESVLLGQLLKPS